MTPPHPPPPHTAPQWQSSFALELSSALLKNWRLKATQTRPWALAFVPGSQCQWHHQEDRHVWQKYQVRQKPTFYSMYSFSSKERTHTLNIAFRHLPPKEGCRKPVLGVWREPTHWRNSIWRKITTKGPISFFAGINTNRTKSSHLKKNNKQQKATPHFFAGMNTNGTRSSHLKKNNNQKPHPIFLLV